MSSATNSARRSPAQRWRAAVNHPFDVVDADIPDVGPVFVKVEKFLRQHAGRGAQLHDGRSRRQEKIAEPAGQLMPFVVQRNGEANVLVELLGDPFEGPPRVPRLDILSYFRHVTLPARRVTFDSSPAARLAFPRLLVHFRFDRERARNRTGTYRRRRPATPCSRQRIRPAPGSAGESGRAGTVNGCGVRAATRRRRSGLPGVNASSSSGASIRAIAVEPGPGEQSAQAPLERLTSAGARSRQYLKSRCCGSVSSLGMPTNRMPPSRSDPAS